MLERKITIIKKTDKFILHIYVLQTKRLNSVEFIDLSQKK